MGSAALACSCKLATARDTWREGREQQRGQVFGRCKLVLDDLLQLARDAPGRRARVDGCSVACMTRPSRARERAPQLAFHRPGPLQETTTSTQQERDRPPYPLQEAARLINIHAALCACQPACHRPDPLQKRPPT